jgi:hypothetical protein
MKIRIIDHKLVMILSSSSMCEAMLSTDPVVSVDGAGTIVVLGDCLWLGDLDNDLQPEERQAPPPRLKIFLSPFGVEPRSCTDTDTAPTAFQFFENT